jgi:uncharacterized protein GlcG (DUF336 family)
MRAEHFVSKVHMVGAWIGSSDVGSTRHLSPARFDIPTKNLAQRSQSGWQYFGIPVSNHDRVMVRRRRPQKRDGKIVDAGGVSGSSAEQNHTVAEADAMAF